MIDDLHAIESKRQRELDSTEISAAVARLLSLGFALILVLPALVQIVAQAPAGRALQEFQVLKGVPDRSRLRAFETTIDASSVLRQQIQPRLQVLLSSWGGFGNDKVDMGRDGWLYYGPGVNYVVGKPFLDADYLRMREKKMVDKEGQTDPAPNPIPALMDLAEDCRRWGIRLVVAPAPDKAMLQATHLARRGSAFRSPTDNASFPSLAAELENAGVQVFQASTAPLDPYVDSYLKQDTHWTPHLMDDYARRLADMLIQGGVSRVPGRRYAFQIERRSFVGDLAQMLKLAPGETLYRPEAIDVEGVWDQETGAAAAPSADSSILLLGDSFTNIYSVASIGWGDHAGLAEHLMYYLNQPIDVIALNGAGSSGVRAELRRGAAAGRLDNKRVLIYEFAIRDLAAENWTRVRLPAPSRRPQLPARPTMMTTTSLPTRQPPAPASTSESNVMGRATPSAGPLPPGAPPNASSPSNAAPGPPVVSPPASSASAPAQGAPSRQNLAATGAEIQLVAELTLISRVPEPGLAPYKDCVGIAKALVSSGPADLANRPILVAFWVMRNDVLLEGAKYRPGDKLRLSLIPFENVDAIVRGTQRSDDTRDYDSPLFWAIRTELVSK